MNFVAHAHVALRTAGSSWDEAFGAALPDLASMAGGRVDRAALPPAVAAGVLLHHRADSAFHALVAFQVGSRLIRTGLLDAGVPTGPARAVGHAGYELLLDGCLLGRAGVQEEFSEVLAQAPDVGAGIRGGDPGRWSALFTTLRDDRWWLGYQDPQMVARGLLRRLRGRPRLAMSEAHLPAVVRVLTELRQRLDAQADEIVEEVVETIRARPPAG